MAKLLKNILVGMQQVLVLWPNVDYEHPSRGGFRTDAKKLREDAMRVTRDLRKKTLVYGKQIHLR